MTINARLTPELRTKYSLSGMTFSEETRSILNYSKVKFNNCKFSHLTDSKQKLIMYAEFHFSR